jgi:hypothetical protein
MRAERLSEANGEDESLLGLPENEIALAQWRTADYLRSGEMCWKADNRLFDGFRGLSQFIGRVALAIALVKQLRPDHALLVDQKGSGIGDPLGSALRLLVEDAVRLDCLATRVGEERELDVPLLRKSRQDWNRVVADSYQLHASGFDLFQVRLQLYQLLLAERSPACRPVEDDRDPAPLEEFAERPLLAGLVQQRERRGLVTHLEPGLLLQWRACRWRERHAAK